MPQLVDQHKRVVMLDALGMMLGVYITMVGFRWISPSKPTADPVKVEEWHRQYGLSMRIFGPALFFVSLGRLLSSLGVFGRQ